MVATDGHRLSLIDKEVSNIEDLRLDGGIMIPKKGMAELNKLASEGGLLQVGFQRNSCLVKRESCTVVIRLLESKFPDYNAVIPKKPKSFIYIDKVNDPVFGEYIPDENHLQGITFYVDRASDVALFIRGREVLVQKNEKDFTGRESISIPLRRLQPFNEVLAEAKK